jgi:hypothetical protein
MSAALLSDPTKHQDFEDDLESFLHVLTWTSLRYCPSNLTDQERSSHLSSIFDEVREKNGVYVGGGWKSGCLVRNAYLPSELVAFSAGSPLLDLLREINPPFAVRYQAPPSKEDFHAYETARTSLEDSTTPSTPLTLSIISTMAPYMIYQQKLQNLKRRSWFPVMIRSYLQNPDLTWPTDDKAERLPLGDKSTATKRQKAQNSIRINSQDAARANSRFPGELDGSAGERSPAKEKRLVKRRKVA